jgi:Na+-driven multidrug efflux pump
MISYLRSRRSIVRLEFRGVVPRRELFIDILKVGAPGLCNIAITNMSVAALTGIAGQLGPETAIGYAMGARLEYILQPVAFGLGTAIVAMVGTNWGARQYRRAREIAWTGAATVALLCGIGSAPSTSASSGRSTSASGWALGCSTSPRASAVALRR